MAKKTVWLPYDFDTAIGINNEGALVFDYSLEDVDHTAGGADVYNGQKSVLWQNVREAYASELKTMYKNLRSSGALSYEKVEKMFEDHQEKWSEAIFNEDAQYKYLDPLIDDGNAAYLSMLQGSKAEQRKWWLFNRFRYLDSKYNAGDALTEVITVRAYAKADVSVTPYASIYASVMFGEGGTLLQERAARNETVTFQCPMDNLNDTAVYFYSADQLSSVGDLSPLKVGYANFSHATKLTHLKIGDSDSSYSNGNLTELYLGNNVLLQTIDVRNCPNLTQAVDLSGCTNLEEAYFEGTSITGVSLPNGGAMKHLHLPATVSSLIVKNQPALSDIILGNSSNISTLVLENVSTAFDSYTLTKGMQPGGRARLIGIEWNVEDANEIIDLLKTLRGIDENDQTTEYAQLSGSIHFGKIRKWQLANLQNRYPYLTITYDSLYDNLLTLYNRNGSAAADVMGAQQWDGVARFPENTPSLGQSYLSGTGRNTYYFPDLTEGISSSVLSFRNAYVYLGFGKSSDTEIIPLASADYITGSNADRETIIYVPDNLVNEYKEATNWSTISDKIQPLSSFDITEWDAWSGTVISS